MPLYEFYCRPCHTIFTFRSARVAPRAEPGCPACGGRLTREVSAFAPIVKGGAANPEESDAPRNDAAAARMEQALASMGSRVEALADEEGDPREAVRVMRDLAEAGGLRFNRDVCEAMDRIESGEDPERVDETFGEVFETDHPFETEAGNATRAVAAWRKMRGPRRDPTWHDLPQ